VIFEPKIHNRLSVEHLMKPGPRALFAGMGLGKTVSTLTAFDGLRMMGLSRAMMVVAPLRVATLTWPNEIEKWEHTKHLKFADLRTREGMKTLQAGKADIYLVNYEQLPKLNRLYLDDTPVYPFDIVTFDELTAARNHNSVRINKVRKKLVPKRGVHRKWGLTGTPTPNSALDLFAQIRLLDGGQRLGPAFEAFRNAWFYPEDYMEYTWLPKPDAEEKIYARISDIVLSLPQEEYSGIPLPIVEDIDIKLPDVATEQYNELADELVLLLKDETEVVANTAATLVNKLLQITGGAVYRADKSVAVIHKAKLDKAVELAQRHRKLNQPLIIACHYKHEQERLLKSIPWAVRFENTKEFLAKWNAGEIPCLVVDPRTLSHGLNMQQGGRHVLWFSVSWSSEIYDQLIGRLARHGQTGQVHVYRILCPGTIDDAVVEALRQKEVGQRSMMATLRNFKRLMQ
jgi:hypothetical protein